MAHLGSTCTRPAPRLVNRQRAQVATGGHFRDLLRDTGCAAQPMLARVLAKRWARRHSEEVIRELAVVATAKSARDSWGTVTGRIDHATKPSLHPRPVSTSAEPRDRRATVFSQKPSMSALENSWLSRRSATSPARRTDSTSRSSRSPSRSAHWRTSSGSRCSSGAPAAPGSPASAPCCCVRRGRCSLKPSAVAVRRAARG